MMRKRWGRIINISSVVGEAGNAGPGELRGVEGRPDRADEIPGAGDRQPQHHGERGRARLHRNRYDQVLPDDVKAKILAPVPLKRFGKPEDIAAAVKFLASEEAVHHRPRARGQRRNVYVALRQRFRGTDRLTKSLAQEMASRNITVITVVAPGYIATDMTKVLPDDVKAKILASVPLARMGKAEDIAAAVKFLASEDASYITGHVLAVNGGMYM